MSVQVPDLAELVLSETEQPIYDRPIGIRPLLVHPVTGAEHYLVRYPEGLRARAHTHSAAHTVVVLEGRLLADGQVLGPGSYVHFPAGQEMHHEPAPGTHCLFVTMFDGPFDVHPSDEAGGSGQ